MAWVRSPYDQYCSLRDVRGLAIRIKANLSLFNNYQVIIIQYATVYLSQAFLVYAGGLFANSGNYKGFGDTKFIPNLPAESLELILKASKAYENDNTHILKLWQNTKNAIYGLAPRLTSLGLANKVISIHIFFS